MMATTIHAAGLVAVAGVFGAMVFLAFVYASPVSGRRRGRWIAVSTLGAMPGKPQPCSHGNQIHPSS